jgi:hypothetical protein
MAIVRHFVVGIRQWLILRPMAHLSCSVCICADSKYPYIWVYGGSQKQHEVPLAAERLPCLSKAMGLWL